jgi:branched-subunit amino acid aminotransferase/4-amino-4-deoxychorismate lyase
LVTPATRRTPPQCLDAKAKITNKMNHHIAWYEARLVDPRCMPLMLDIEGNISETHHGNFFFASNGRLFTPFEKNVLGGVTRSTIFALAEELGVPVIEGNYTPYDVYTANGTTMWIGRGGNCCVTADADSATRASIIILEMRDIGAPPLARAFRSRVIGVPLRNPLLRRPSQLTCCERGP